jgi:hypothetical protein
VNATVTRRPPTLNSLDAVLWRRLRHAQGKAKGTPKQLRALLDPDQKTRERALVALQDTLCHQDYQVSETSLAALPFLFELVAWRKMPQRDDLLDLLVCIAHGNGWFQGHSGLPVAGLTLGRATIDRRLDAERSLLAQIAAAINARQAEIAALLDDRDGDIAAGSMRLVECLPVREPVVQAALDRCLERADYAEIRASAAAAIAASEEAQAIERLRGRLSHETDPLARLSMTVGLLLHRQPLDGPAIDLALAAVAGRLPDLLADYNRLPCSLGAATLFALIAEQHPEAARARLPEFIEAISGESYLAEYEAAGLLYLAAEPNGDGFPPGVLTHEQRQALEAVACATWCRRPFERIRGGRPVPRLQRVLRAFGLPDDVNGLRGRLGYPPRPDAFPSSGR